MLKLKAFYGVDPDGGGEGFYWPASPGKRAEIYTVRRGAPSEYESIYQCRPGSRTGSIFIESDFNYYTPPEGLQNGISSPKVKEFCEKGHGVYGSWDTAFEDTKDSAYTVCITALFVACQHYHRNEDAVIYGACDHHYDVLILDVYRERISWGDLTDAFRLQRSKWQPELSVVEKRMSGISLVQSAQAAGIPIYAAIPVESKRARAINGVGAGSAQGWFRQHRVLFPGPFRDGSIVPWMQALKTELKDFSGDDSGYSDQVDALVHLLRFAIMEGANTALLPSDWSPERGSNADVETAMQSMRESKIPGQERGVFWAMLGDLENMSVDPFGEVCGRCESFHGNRCTLRDVNVTALDSCAMFSSKGT